MNANETKKLNAETAEAELTAEQLDDVTGAGIESFNIAGYGNEEIRPDLR